MIFPGTRLQGRYRVIHQVGGGGFGKVFEVDDGGISKVLKVLSLERFHNRAIKQKAIALFQREAELLSRLKHPGIPRVEPGAYFTWSDGSGEPLYCLVMEKIPGSNLQQWLYVKGNQPISSEQARDWLIQLVEILDELHLYQYLHRDIKLTNIMLKPDGQLVLIDFGAVREITTTYLEKQQGHQTGTVLISPGFTPPEQAEGHAVPQSDFFALGRTFVYLLTGQSPVDFPKDSHSGTLLWRDRAPNVSPDIANLVDDLMAPFPGHRPKNCQEILNCLRGVPQPSYFPLQDGADTAPGSDFATTASVIKPQQKALFSTQVKQDTLTTAIAQTIRDCNPVSPTPHFDRIPINRKFQVLLTGFFLVLAGSINLWQYRPYIADNLNNQGLVHYEHKSFGSAELYYRLALLFYPDTPQSLYNLGLLYEDRQDFENARIFYEKATEKHLAVAYNNLARLNILDKQYTSAEQLLHEGLSTANKNETKYVILKNLGWTYLEMGRYQEAQKYLQQAMNIFSDRATAYCLQAKVLERQKNKFQTLAPWKNCVKYSHGDTPEETQWVKEGLKRIQENSSD
ncbi:MAG: serine/threonine-protein kinase [Scytonema sp. PMC 1069.18]|nr:serine/threonine-protein kinase [Scytonema sp. PMC 1069.18]MEC4881597.1 serine/threonine-protein kinase [Scytonema sp. PMC 1070.18]